MCHLVIFLDLDDTILQTAPKCPPDQLLHPAAVDRTGAALSFMTPGQQRLLDLWMAQGTVIPVTGRTEDALARVLIPFNSWRITHHGAVIRQPDGQLPPWWSVEVEPHLRQAQPALQMLAEDLERNAAAAGYRVSRHQVSLPDAEPCVTYLSVKAQADETVLVALRQRLESAGLAPTLALHHNGHNLAVTVRGAQKHDAVRRVIAALKRTGPLLTLGAGDSVTDIPFLRVCDFALTPKDSQIQQQTWGDVLP